MIASLSPQGEKTFVVLVMRVRRQFGRDTLNLGKISQMPSGTMLTISCEETEVSLNGHSRVQMLMANGQKLRAAIFLRFEMEKSLSKIRIERIDL